MKTMVKPKKHLGQHFLKDKNIAAKLDAAIPDTTTPLLEIGPGMGMLTNLLLKRDNILKVIEIDKESVKYLNNNFPELSPDIINDDFLKFDPTAYFPGEFSIVGNFPYNISSQILFRLIELKEKTPFLCGMFQKEVALRIASHHGSKQYGILTVLLQTWFCVKVLFFVSEKVFYPPPDVKSAVVLLTKKDNPDPVSDEKLFVKIVKTAFNQRRKKLRNALSPLFSLSENSCFAEKRAEQLSVKDFYELYCEILKSQ